MKKKIFSLASVILFVVCLLYNPTAEGRGFRYVEGFLPSAALVGEMVVNPGLEAIGADTRAFEFGLFRQYSNADMYRLRFTKDLMACCLIETASGAGQNGKVNTLASVGYASRPNEVALLAVGMLVGLHCDKQKSVEVVQWCMNNLGKGNNVRSMLDGQYYGVSCSLADNFRDENNNKMPMIIIKAIDPQ